MQTKMLAIIMKNTKIAILPNNPKLEVLQLLSIANFV